MATSYSSIQHRMTPTMRKKLYYDFHGAVYGPEAFEWTSPTTAHRDSGFNRFTVRWDETRDEWLYNDVRRPL